MNFRKYNSIENTYRQKVIDQILQFGFASGNWVVEEKVHGANLSLWYDGSEMLIGKRSGFISDNKSFYSSYKLIPKYQEKVKSLHAELGGVITIYGELFGGHYPHPDIERVKNVKQVQGGVYYNPDIDFYAFDIAHNGKILNLDEAHALFEKHGFFYSEPLFAGSFEDCLKYKNEFQTTIPIRLGLPEIKDNICEGVVIKPVETKYLHSGSRVILKNKNERFTEKSKPKRKKSKLEIKLSENGQKLFDELNSYINENRLRNVISKIGQITDKDFGRILGLLNKDALEDFNKDFGQDFNKLEDKEQKIIKKKIGSVSSDLIRRNFINIIDGIF